MKFVNLNQHDRFRPLSGNKGNQRAGKHARGLSVEPVSVPSRGIRVINRMDKTKADLR